jgi:hypothetical protein
VPSHGVGDHSDPWLLGAIKRTSNRVEDDPLRRSSHRPAKPRLGHLMKMLDEFCTVHR